MKKSIRYQLDRKLESYGLLNYQTKNLSQEEIAQRYADFQANTGVRVKTDSKWYQENYKDRISSPLQIAPNPIRQIAPNPSSSIPLNSTLVPQNDPMNDPRRSRGYVPQYLPTQMPQPGDKFEYRYSTYPNENGNIPGQEWQRNYQLMLYNTLGYVPSEGQDPRWIADAYNQIKAASDDSKLPEHIRAQKSQIIEAYNWFSFRNNNKPWTEWSYLDAGDPAQEFLYNIRGAPPPQEYYPQVYATIDQVKSGQAMWADVHPKDKIAMLQNPDFYKAGITAFPLYARQEITADPDFQWEHLPDWHKKYYEITSNPYVMALPMAISGAYIGSYAGPAGTVVGAIGGELLGVHGSKDFNPAGGWKDQPTFASKGMYLLNELAQKMEQATWMVAGVAPALVYKENREILSKKGALEAQWEAGRTFWDYALGLRVQDLLPAYEYAQELNKNFIKDPVGHLSAIIEVRKAWQMKTPEEKRKGDIRNDIAKRLGLDIQFAAPGEGHVIGASEPVRIAEYNPDMSSLAIQSGSVINDKAQYIMDEIAKGRDRIEVVNEVMTEAQSTVGGQIGDFIGQAAVDPLEWIPGLTNLGISKALKAKAPVAAAAFSGTKSPLKAAQLYRTLVQTPAMRNIIDPNFDVSAMGNVARFFGGINSKGEIKAGPFSDRGLTDVSPRKAGIMSWLAETATLDPRSRANLATQMFHNNIGSLISGMPTVKDAVSFLKILATGADMGKWAELGETIANSPQMYAVLPALKAFTFEKLDTIVAAVEGTREYSDYLNKIASILDVDPAKYLDDLEQSGTKEQDFFRLVEKVNQDRTSPEAAALRADIQNGTLTANVMASMVNAFTGKDALPWNDSQWKLMIYDALGTHYDKWAAKHFQLKPDSFVFRTSAVLKAAQSLLLLGFNPAYAITDQIGNMANRAATGIYGYMTPRQITSWMDRFGVTPARMEEAFGFMGIEPDKTAGVHDDAQRAAMRGGGLLQKAHDILRGANRYAPFNALASMFEKFEGKQSFVIAMRQFWGQAWKRGVGYRNMPTGLLQELRRAGINPEIFYKAIEAGMNQAEIERAIYAKQIGIQARTLVEEAANLSGVSFRAASEALEKIGVLDVLDAELSAAKTPRNVQAAFDRARRTARRAIDMALKEDIVARVPEVTNKLDLEGATAMLDVFVATTHPYITAWYEHFMRMGNLWNTIDPTADPAFTNKQVEIEYTKSSDHFRAVNAMQAATWKAALNKQGMLTSDFGRTMLATTANIDRAYADAYAFMLDAKRKHYDKYKGKWADRNMSKDWDALKTSVTKKFEEAFAIEEKENIAQRDAYEKYYGEKYGETAGEAARQLFQDIIDFRRDMLERMKAQRETGQPYSREFYQNVYMPMIIEMGRIKDQGIGVLRRQIIGGEPEAASPVPPAPEVVPPAPAPVTPAPEVVPPTPAPVTPEPAPVTPVPAPEPAPVTPVPAPVRPKKKTKKPVVTTPPKPLTQEAKDYLDSISTGTPLGDDHYVPNNLRRIAMENNVTTIDKRSDINEALKKIQAEYDAFDHASYNAKEAEKIELDRARRERIVIETKMKNDLFDIAEQYLAEDKFGGKISRENSHHDLLVRMILQEERFGGYPEIKSYTWGQILELITPEGARRVFEKRKEYYDAQRDPTPAPVTPATPKQKKSATEANTSLLQAIKKAGGIHKADGERYIADWKKYPSGVFTDGPRSWALDEIARIMWEEWFFDIDPNKPETTETNQLLALMEKDRSGQHVYPITHELSESQMAAAELEHIKTQMADVEIHKAKVLAAAAELDSATVADLYIEADQNFPTHTDYGEWILEVFHEVLQAQHKAEQDKSIADAMTASDIYVKEQMLAGDAAMTREILIERYERAFPNVSSEQISQWVEATDAALRTMGKALGKTKEEMYLYYRDIIRSREEDVEGNIFQQRGKAAPVWYSKLISTVESVSQPKMTVNQLKGMLFKAGVKEDEIKTMGLEAFLEGKKNVTKEEVTEFLRENEVRVDDVWKGLEKVNWIEDVNWNGEKVWKLDGVSSVITKGEGDYYFAFGLMYDTLEQAQAAVLSARTKNAPKFSQYTLPGGENYRELLFTLPSESKAQMAQLAEERWKVAAEFSKTLQSDAKHQELQDKIYEANQNFLNARTMTERDNYKRLRGKYEDMLEQYVQTAPATAQLSARLAEIDKQIAANKEKKADYESRHWSEPNVLAHTRLNDRIDADGKRVLFVEEMQSDWHQAGRQKGYNNELPKGWTVENFQPELGPRKWQVLDENGTQRYASESREEAIKGANDLRGAKIPDAPFSKTWHELVMKRVLRIAAEGGYDRVAWTTGDQQYQRWGSERFDWKKKGDGWIMVGKEQHSGHAGNVDIEAQAERAGILKKATQTISTKEELREMMEDVMSRELSDWSEANRKKHMDKMVEKVWGRMQAETEGTYLPRREGMQGFYDKILVDFANKYAKQWGAKTGTTEINASGLDALGAFLDAQFPTVHSIDVTPSMRESVMKGQPLFQGAERTKGAIQFLDGRAVIHAFESGDFSTVVHENFHLFRRMIRDAAARTGNNEWANDYANLQSWVQDEARRINKKIESQEALTDYENAVSGGEMIPEMADEVWERGHEEIAARAGERYIAEGKAPTSALARIFQNFKEWLLDIYKQITGSEIDVNVPENVREVLDRLFGAEKAEASDNPVIDIEYLNSQADFVFSHKNTKKAAAYFDTVARAELHRINKNTKLQNIVIERAKNILDDLRKEAAEQEQKVTSIPAERQQEYDGNFLMNLEKVQAGIEEPQDIAEPTLNNSGLLPGLDQPMSAGEQGILLGIQPGAGGRIQKMDTGSARSLYDVDKTRTLKDKAGTEVKAGDIVRDERGSQHTVRGANMRGKILTTEGRILEPGEVEKVARQEDMFGGLIEEKKPEAVAEPVKAPEVDEVHGKLDDFGEKLGGARKDKAQQAKEDFAAFAGLDDAALASMKISEIFPKSMIDDIEDTGIAAFAKTVRDAIPSKPRDKWKLKRWVEDVKILQGLMRTATDTGLDTALKNTALYFKMKEVFTPKVNILRDVPREQWGRLGDVHYYHDAYTYKDGQKIPKPWGNADVDGKNVWVDGDYETFKAAVVEKLSGDKVQPASVMKFQVRTFKDGVYINKEGDPLYRKLKIFSKADEAFEFIKNNRDELLQAWESVKDRDNVKETDLRGAENAPRVGRNHRQGVDATPQMFLDNFAFRGVEFGNWVKQGANAKERQGMLNDAYDALYDLAEIVNVPPKALSLNGTLGLGLGSRGSGSASAHYEAGNIVINLTKTRGAGSLAHEWFHALDNYFSRKRGVTEFHAGALDAQDAYRKGSYITYKPEPLMVRKGGTTTMTAADLKRMREAHPKNSWYDIKDWEVDPNHPEGVRPEVEKRFAELVEALDNSPMTERVKLLDKGRGDGYWSRIIERAARSFENYIIAKMAQSGFRNDYLANVLKIEEFVRDPGRYPYLLDEELKPVLEAFDNLFSTMKVDENAALYQRAFHGSPYKFQKFSTDYMGMGDGYQSYGWGLYFASKKDIAEHYRKDVSEARDIGIQLSSLTDEQNAKLPNWVKRTIEADGEAGLQRIIDNFQGRVLEEEAELDNPNVLQPWLVKDRLANAQEFVKIAKGLQGKDLSSKEAGQLYAVEIPDDNYLLWDKPLSEQPWIKEALQKSGLWEELAPSIKNQPDWMPVSGKQVYDDLKSVMRWRDMKQGIEGRMDAEYAKAASLALKDAGINGIQYLDGSSRGKGEGDYNYVIFDDEAISILETFYQKQRKQKTADPFKDADPRVPLGTLENASQTMQHGQILSDGWDQHVGPLMDAMERVALDRLDSRKLEGASRDLSPEGNAMLKKYMKQVAADMAGTKLATIQHGEQQRDFAMLNYNKRYGFDKFLDVVYPYQFFYTRSMINWAMRALDKPHWFANYARLARLRNSRENDLPERLRNKIKFHAPWLPDFMGDALYIDPMKALFTPSSFLTPFEQMERDQNSQEQEAVRILQEWSADGRVDEDEVVEAMNRKGATWERALAEAKIRREAQISNPMDFFHTMLGPAWYLTTPYKMLTGKGDSIQPLPITKTANAVEAVTKGTWAEDFGKVVGLLGKPEKAARNAAGYSEFGEYGEYYIDRQLANLVAEGKYTSEQAILAMVERKGPAYDEAYQRVQMELAMRVPTAGTLYNLVRGNAQGTAQSLVPSLFSAGILPEGELKYRGLQDDWYAAVKQAEAGDTTAFRAFFDEHPEYETYLAKNKEPEERLKSFLVGQVWDGYMRLGDTDRKTAVKAMGNIFEKSFLDRETRDTQAIPTEVLARWAQMLNMMTPKKSEQVPGVPEQEAAPIQYYPEEVTRITDEYFQTRKKDFPNYYWQQQGYYSLPKSQRAGYLLQFPEFKKYLDWKYSQYDKYPELVPIFNGDAFETVDTSQWPVGLEEALISYAYSGTKLGSGAWKALEQAWLKAGMPMGDVQTWLDSQVAPSLLYTNGFANP